MVCTTSETTFKAFESGGLASAVGVQSLADISIRVYNQDCWMGCALCFGGASLLTAQLAGQGHLPTDCLSHHVLETSAGSDSIASIAEVSMAIVGIPLVLK